MTTAVGAYTTRARIKARLSIPTLTTDWDAQIDTVADAVNAFIESPAGCGRVIAPISSATYLLDGDGSSWLYFPKGIRAISALSVGAYTGFTPLDAIAATDYYLRPLVQDRPPGWPAFYVVFSDRPAGTYRTFREGRETVSLTCTAGWAAIPDDLSEMADSVGSTMFHALEQGNQPIPNTGELGQPIVARFFSGKDFDTMRAYRVKKPALVTRSLTW